MTFEPNHCRRGIIGKSILAIIVLTVLLVGGLAFTTSTVNGPVTQMVPLNGNELNGNEATPPAPDGQTEPNAEELAGQSQAGDAQSSTPEDPHAPASLRDQLVGRWELKDSIYRSISMKADGTATMHVTLDFFGSLLYGKEMDLQLTWNLKDHVLTHKIVSGTPTSNVARLVQDFGDQRSYRVVEATPDELLLEEKSSSGAVTKYRWENLDHGS